MTTSDIKFKEILDLEGRTVAEEIKPGLIAIRQSKALSTRPDVDTHVVYLTVDTIKHLAEVLTDEPAADYTIPGFENLEESLSWMSIRK